MERRKHDVLPEEKEKCNCRRRAGILTVISALLCGLCFILLATQVLAPQTPAEYKLTASVAETVAADIPPSTSPSETATPTLPGKSTVPSEPVSGLEELVVSLLEDMTLEEKIYQVFFVLPEDLGGNTVAFDESTQNALNASPVGGIILFSKNLENREQCIKMIADYQNASRTPMFVGVDEEGGTVCRLSSNPSMGVTFYPPMQEIGTSMDLDAAYHVGFTLGTELKSLGFNLDFAPVADVNTNPDNPVIGSRAFSSDSGIAADMVSSCVCGFREARMISCIKHFPGHGDTQTDTHFGSAQTSKTLDEMQQEEFLPFRSGIEAGAPVVMIGHISCPNITGDEVPASLSPEIVTDVLRKDLGFQGVVITDAMNMGAIAECYPSGEAAVLALEAGCDMILVPDDLQEAAAAVRSALNSGRLTEKRLDESILRILKLKLEYGIIPYEIS